MRRYLTAAVASGLLLLVAVVFWRAQHGEFLNWDDDINITRNPHLHGLSAANVEWMFTDIKHMRRYVPITWLSWAIEYEFTGLSARSAHLGNLALHAANTLLAFALIRRLLHRAPRGEAAAPAATETLAASAAALLWAVHPLRVEVVAWASGRIYCLATFFLLVASIAYLRAADPGRDRRMWISASWVAYVLSLLTYPLAAAFVAVLLVLDWHVLGRIGGAHGWRDPVVWREKAAFAAPAVVIAAITVYARLNATGHWQDVPAPTLAQFGMLPRLAQACYVAVCPLWRSVWPTHLSPVYTTLVRFDPLEARFIASAVVVLALTIVCWLARARRPAMLAAWFAYMALVSPLLGFSEHPHYPNDRYSQLATLAIAALIGGGIVEISKRRRIQTSIWALAGGCTAGLAFASFGQVTRWRDTPTLLNYVLGTVDDNRYRADILVRLGEYDLSRGDLAAAAGHFREATREHPQMAAPWSGLGRVAELQGRPGDAVEAYRRGLAIRPISAELSRALGNALRQHGSRDEAVAVLSAAIARHPEEPGLRIALGQCHAESGRFADAIMQFSEAVRLQPDSAAAHFDLGMSLLKIGERENACAHFRQVLRLQPTHDAARQQLELLTR